MNAEPKNFEQLCRLLKLKQHESPPPRYFNDFSVQVLSRIRAGTPGSRFESFEEIVSQSLWVRRFWRLIEHRPAVSGLFTAAACGLLIVGVFKSDNAPPSLTITTDGMARVESPAGRQPGPAGLVAVGAAPSGLLFENSTNPAIQLRSGDSLFGEFPGLGAPQRVNGMPIVPR